MSKLKFFVVVGILVLGLLLRLHNYSVYPQRGATSDEYAFAFLGISLLTKYEPIAWSAIPLYQDRKDLTIDKIYFPVVKPYMDHPPLFGLVVGGWALLFGQDTFQKVSLEIIRLIPLFLTVFSCLLVFFIAKRVYTFKIGIWALLIYSTATVYVVNSRVAVAETLMTPLLLLSVFLLTFKKNQKNFIQLGVVAGLAFLSKVLGIIAFITIVSFFFIEKVKRSVFIKFVLIFLLFASVFIIYGLVFGKELFWQVQIYQGKRLLGPETLWTILGSPIIVNKIIYDGWYLFGLFSLFFLLSDFIKHKFILVPSFFYLFLVLMTATHNQVHGWYLLPLFPFMAIASAYVLDYIIRKKSFLIFVFLIVVGISIGGQLLQNTIGIAPLRYRVLSSLALVPGIYLLFGGKERLYPMMAAFWFYLFILMTIINTILYKHPA